MKIIVLGSGLIGICSAYFLQKSGHQVTVIDQESEPSMGTSFANGGQISVGYSEPWASISNLKKMKDWIGSPTAPIIINPIEVIKNPSWFIDFFKQCLPSNNVKNIQSMLKISGFSRDTLQSLRLENNLQYNQNTNGIITYYTSENSYKGAKTANKIFNDNGCNRQMKTFDELVQIEPTLAHSSFRIFGGDYLAEDESGDAKLFTQQMFSICKKIGVHFIFNHSISASPNSVSSANLNYVLIKNDLIKDSPHEEISADAFICCLGSYSKKFINQLEIPNNILLYPVKGYSATIPIIELEKVNSVSLTDSDKKIVFTRLGDQLRVAGTAEFNGFDTYLNQERCYPLKDRANKLFPNSLDINNIKYWTGLRPTTPHGSPYIKVSSLNNLYYNFGHGTLGFTMAAGSGKLISQIINKEKQFE